MNEIAELKKREYISRKAPVIREEGFIYPGYPSRIRYCQYSKGPLRSERKYLTTLEAIGETVFSVQDQSFVLPSSLSNIIKAILDSSYLLELEDNWDEEDADATNFETYKRAIDFIIVYATTIWKNYGFRLATPFIDITRDGSISVYWSTTKGSFFIIFKKDSKEYAYYYGQEKEGQVNIPFKYRVKLDSLLNEITLSWMIQNLT